MKHVKILSMPDCDKLIYSGGIIARQIGALMVVNDENPIDTLSYPIVAGGHGSGGFPLSDLCRYR